MSCWRGLLRRLDCCCLEIRRMKMMMDRKRISIIEFSMHEEKWQTLKIRSFFLCLFFQIFVLSMCENGIRNREDSFVEDGEE